MSDRCTPNPPGPLGAPDAAGQTVAAPQAAQDQTVAAPQAAQDQTVAAPQTAQGQTVAAPQAAQGQTVAAPQAAQGAGGAILREEVEVWVNEGGAGGEPGP